MRYHLTISRYKASSIAASPFPWTTPTRSIGPSSATYRESKSVALVVLQVGLKPRKFARAFIATGRQHDLPSAFSSTLELRVQPVPRPAGTGRHRIRTGRL